MECEVSHLINSRKIRERDISWHCSLSLSLLVLSVNKKQQTEAEDQWEVDLKQAAGSTSPDSDNVHSLKQDQLKHLNLFINVYKLLHTFWLTQGFMICWVTSIRCLIRQRIFLWRPRKGSMDIWRMKHFEKGCIKILKDWVQPTINVSHHLLLLMI